MFLVRNGHGRIAQRILGLFYKEPSIGLVIAAVYFEWTLSRAIIALSQAPNVEVRERLRRAYGLDKYKDLWVTEIPSAPRLPQLLKDWARVTDAFDARGALVHGRDRYTRNMARPHVDVLLASARDIWDFCAECGRDLRRRLPVRRKPRARQGRAKISSP
jgi:hypothetical protein